MAQLLAGQRPSLTVGGRVFTDLGNLKILGSYITNTSRWSTFRDLNGSAGYQVTSGKTLRVSALKFQTIVASGSGTDLQLLYNDNDLGFDHSSTPAGAVYMLGTSTMRAVSYINSAGLAGAEVGIDFEVLATKYLSCITGFVVSQYAFAYGYEV